MAGTLRFALCAVLLVGCGLGIAQDKSVSTSADVVAADSAMAAYWHDLASTLARSNDAHALLTAALVDGLSQRTPTQERFNELIARAQQAAPDDALVWWIAATQCRPTGAHCEDAQAAARAQLARIDPDNVSTWLLEMAHAYQTDDRDGTRAALAKAAAASHYNDHLIDAVVMLADQFEAHPMPSAMPDAQRAGNVSSAREARTSAWAIAAALVMPALQPVLRVCTPDKKPVGDPITYRQCLDVAQSLAVGSSLIGSSIGVAIEARLLKGTAREAEAESRRRALSWLMANQMVIGSEDAVDVRSNDESAYFMELRRTRSESQALASRMKAHQIPLEPPADWKGPRVDKS